MSRIVPHSFLERHRIKTTALYQFCVPVGWENILERLVRTLIAIGWDRRLSQAKEKFGGLRFHIVEGCDGSQEHIDAAEKESNTVCQDCGAKGEKMDVNSWWKTLCGACWLKYTNQIKTRG